MEFSYLLDGMIFGNFNSIPADWIFLLSRTGLIHFLSASGYHTNVALEISKALSRWICGALSLGPSQRKITKLCLIFTLLTLFAAATGWSSPMTRAYCNGLLLVVAEIFERKFNRFHVLGISVGFALLLGKGSWLSISLSVVSTAAILLTQDKSLAWRILAPWLASAPLVLFFFHSISYFSPLWNLLFGPPLAWVILPLWVLGKITVFLLPASALIQETAIFLITMWLDMLNSCDQLLGGARWVPLHTWAAFSTVGVVLFILPISNKMHGTGAAALSIAAFFLCRSPSLLMLDVGQGDSIFLETQSQKKILIDLGPPGFHGGLPRGSRELEKYGIGTVDAILLTHLDFDHQGGLESLLFRHKVSQGLWLREEFLSEPRALSLLEKLERTSTPFHLITEEKSVPGSTCFLLNGKKGNDLCPICIFTLKNGKTFLSTGDVSQKVEKQMEKILHENLKIDYLKVAHHGSRYSSSTEFLAHFPGAQALISVGKKNQYHHPHPDTLKRLTESGLSVRRTDQLGSIAF